MLPPLRQSRLTAEHTRQLDGIVRRLHATLASLASPQPAMAARSLLCAHLANQAAALDANWNAQAAGTRAQARLAARTRAHLRTLATPVPTAAPAASSQLLQELRRTEAELRLLLRQTGSQGDRTELA